MRGLKRNQKQLWYQLYNNMIPVYETDLDSNVIYDPVTDEPLLTGDYEVAMPLRCHLRQVCLRREESLQTTHSV